MKDVKFVKWDADRLIEQVQSVCVLTDSGCWLWRYGVWSNDDGSVDGYPGMMINGKRDSVARWVLKVTTGCVGEVARHSCDVPACCNPEHLSWGTHADNVNDALERGRRPRRVIKEKPAPKTPVYARGEAHGRAKLDEALVHTIRQRHTDGDSMYRLALDYGVTKKCIAQIVRRETWSHI